MIGHITGQMKPGPKSSLENVWEKRSVSGYRREEILHSIDDLHALSRRGLWKLLLFLGISTAALQARDFDLFGAFPENVQEVLGAPPSPELVHVVLAVSTISALILHYGNGVEKARGSSGWLQFGMAAFFYPLYAMSNTLSTWFPLVCVAGLIALFFEHLTIWTQTSRAIHEEKERLARMHDLEMVVKLLKNLLYEWRPIMKATGKKPTSGKIISCVILGIVAGGTVALSAVADIDKGSGIMAILFIAFLGAIITVQIIPGMMLFGMMLKGLANLVRKEESTRESK